MDVEDINQKVNSRSRRALGDITNATSAEGPSGVKKAATGDGIIQQATSSDLSMEDRPYMRRPADDIDERDAENPLLCTEVVNQMYDNFGEAEKGK